jgi:UMF1 family MFS transporter
MYDWAYSVYSTNIMAAIFPIYFASVCRGAGVQGDYWWGIGTSIATAVIAILAPLLGALGDYKGMKKKLFGVFLVIGLGFTGYMAFTDDWKGMLIGYILSYIGYAGTELFYDSFLTDVTSSKRMDRVSSWGYAMGYIGGSTIPFLISIGVLVVLGMSNPLGAKAAVLITCVWWLIFSLPILRNVKQQHYIQEKGSFASVFKNVGRTLKGVVKTKSIFVFMLAYFFYIDGVNTVIHMATAYGTTLGLDSVGMILALVVTQIVAVPFSILFSSISKKIGSMRLITIAVCIYCVICGVGFYMGFSLEPYQADYQAKLETSISEAAAQSLPSFSSNRSSALFAEIINGDGEEIRGLKVEAVALLPEENRAELASKLMTGEGGYIERYTPEFEQISKGDAAKFKTAMEDIDKTVSSFLKDKDRSAPYENALQFSFILFWAMAVLVGTVQGGIQAISRAHFSKLVPKERSNEYFGVYDIFGKFACIIGPLLYSLFSGLTGRPSIGILSVIILFAVSLIIIIIGHKYLQNPVGEAE